MTVGPALLPPLAWRSLWRNPRRTAITLSVVAVGLWSILTFDVMLKAWAVNSREQALRLLTCEAQVHAPGYLDDPAVTLAMARPDHALRAVLDGPAVAAWAPRIRLPAIVRSEYRTRAVTLLGVSPVAERVVSDLPGQIVRGRYLASDNDTGLVIGRDLALRLKTRLGKRVIVMVKDVDGKLSETGYEVIGLFGNTRGAQDAYVFTGLSAAGSATGLGGRLSEICLQSRDGARLDDVVARVRRAAPGLDVQPWTVLSPLAYTMESISGAYIAIWLGVVFVLMAIGVVNTQLMAVFERTREFGLLLALGMRPRLILLQVVMESAMLMGLGVMAGGLLTAATILPLAGGVDMAPFAAAAELGGGGGRLQPRLDLGDGVCLTLIVWAMGVLATLWPACAAARTDPAVSMASA